MLKSHLAIALVTVAALFAGTAAFAQSPYAQSNTPVYVPMSAQHQQAQLANEPGRCGGDVARAQDNIALRMQQYNGLETRASVNGALQTAATFAANGNDEDCWHWFDRAQSVVR